MVTKRKKEAYKKRVRELFAGKTELSQQFHIILIIINIFVFSLFVIEAAYPQMHTLIKAIEIGFGIVFLTEYLAQLWISKRKAHFVLNVFNLIDVLVILSLFMPLMVVNFAALRLIKWIRILRVYRIMRLTKIKSPAIAHNWDLVESVVHFMLFLVVTTLVVYATQSGHNPHIETHIDALYFTVTDLAPNGQNVVAVGQAGRLLSVLTLLVGIMLFARMSHAVFLGKRKLIACPKCGLDSHELDATRCRRCGSLLKRAAVRRRKTAG